MSRDWPAAQGGGSSGIMGTRTKDAKVAFMQGNDAMLEGALAAGARFYAGYPITPSSEIAQQAARRLPALGGTYIQMEDEIASMAAIIGAALGGARSFTATSGPGFSLMQENLGVAIMAEVPCVVINVQRSGPSTGLATKPAQADLMQARWGTHGDHAIIALAPSSVQDCFDLTRLAFTLADAYRSPVLILADEIVGHMRERLTVPTGEVADPRPVPGEGPYRPFEVRDGSLVPLAHFGGPHVFHVTSSMHGPSGLADNSPANAAAKIQRLHDKIEGQTPELTRARLHRGRAVLELAGTGALQEALDAGPSGDVLLVSYGASARSCMEVAQQPPRGLQVELLELLTVWPFPDWLVSGLGRLYPQVTVVELNLGQMVREVVRVLGPDREIRSCGRWDGGDITPQQICELIGGVGE